jgi:hypothetical protein
MDLIITSSQSADNLLAQILIYKQSVIGGTIITHKFPFTVPPLLAAHTGAAAIPQTAAMTAIVNTFLFIIYTLPFAFCPTLSNFYLLKLQKHLLQ